MNNINNEITLVIGVKSSQQKQVVPSLEKGRNRKATTEVMAFRPKFDRFA